MKHTNTKKMATTLLYINKKTIVTNNDETHTIKYEEKNQIKYNANSNSFAYLLKSDNKPEIKNDDLMVGIVCKNRGLKYFFFLNCFGLSPKPFLLLKLVLSYLYLYYY